MKIRRLGDRHVAVLFAMWGLIRLSACGGADDSAAEAPPPIPVEPDPVTSVPPASYADADRKLAFDRLNEARAQAGLGLLEQNAQLDQAAQSHSEYQSANGGPTHDERYGNLGFTGEDPTSRAQVAGYSPDRLTEVVAAAGYRMTGRNTVDTLLSTPYHRMGMLYFHPIDIGVGFFGGEGEFKYLTMLGGRRSGRSQGLPSRSFITWPVDGAIGVPLSMWKEKPNPIPENQGRPAGLPASLQVNDAFRELHVDTFEIHDSAANVIATKTLVAATDLNLLSFVGGRSFAAALPRQPLQKNTRYHVRFIGYSKLISDQSTSPIDVTWSFTTGEGDGF